MISRSCCKVPTLCSLNNTGRRWIKQMFIGAFMIPAMVCGTAFFINFIAIYYHASRAIPFGTMVGLTQWPHSVESIQLQVEKTVGFWVKKSSLAHLKHKSCSTRNNAFCLLQVAVCCICFFVILPLNLVGTILGRNLSGQPNFPCRVNAVPRPIPEKKWYVWPERGSVQEKVTLKLRWSVTRLS